MRLRIDTFMGEIPRLRPRALPPGYAAAAVNARLDDGALLPFSRSLLEKGLDADAETIYLHGAEWLGWASVVNAAQGPVAQDRLYYTGDGSPKMRVSGSVYPLALTAPAAPSAALQGLPDDAESVAESVIYATTHVTSFGEESAPSEASSPVLWRAGQNVEITGLAAPPAGRAITHRRIYRSSTSATGITDFYFVAEIPAAQTSYTHDIEAAPIQEIISSTNFDPPPDGMAGLTPMANGMMAAFNGRELLFCEPFVPHAWPEAYRLTVDHPIVGLAAFGSMLAVLTEATPYIAQGSAPDSMVLEKVEGGLPCLSGRGVVDLGFSAVYPSPDGLVAISASGAPQVVTQPLFTPEQWRALNPASFRAAAHQGRYAFSYDPGAGPRMGVIDLSGASPFFIQSDIAPASLFRDDASGALYWLDGARRIMRWDAVGAPHMAMRWRSAEYFMAAPVNFAAFLLDPDHDRLRENHRATCRVWADGIQIFATDAIDRPVRMPSGFLARRWQVEIEGDAPVAAVTMAQSIEELSV
jgi:hypothetical protein